ncbi:major Facilitator Superfamily protein [Paecilomyces variotii No. 5]|uniref:Major Facilitator Superfamily protein n=1 Tax=Byssochlamys spectabilis (strain No. 5 / NBRC 109023) TaxID=1356009 RepID=V5G125_BYSSN|nr:major Facilitator Superfamily protein [Paecilomyces variotii No. 5]
MSLDLDYRSRDPSTDPARPPDGGYGWICVAALFCVNAFTWGASVQTYGVYLANYLADDRFPEATLVDYALIGGLNLSMAMLVAPGVTFIVRKYETQVSMLIGVAFMVCGFVLASFARRIWQLYLTQGVLIGVGVGFTYVPSIPIISQWFDKKRSLANGISSAGSGIGGLIYSFLTQALIDRLSVPWALRITGIISGSFLFLATLLIRNRNKAIRPTQRAFDLKLLRRLDVLLFLAWGFISMFGYITLSYSLPDYARSLGLSGEQAASVNALLNVGNAIGRLCTGLASDRFGRIEIAGLLTCVCGLSCFAIWMPATSYGVLLFFAFFAGGILGVFYVTVGPVSVEVVGLVELQSLLSLAWFTTVLPTTFSEVIALKLRREGSKHEYLYPQVFAGLSYCVASMFLLVLWWRMRIRGR